MEVNQSVVDEQINKYKGKVDGVVEKVLGIVGDHPWQDWLAKSNDLVAKYIPAVIALAGVLACVTGVVTMIKIDAPFSMVVNQLWILLPVLFAMHLAPKAMGLIRSLVEKNEVLAVRPEVLYIMKVIFGLGGILLGIYLFLNFDSDLIVPGIISVVFAILMIISLDRPEVVSIKADYPTNCVEEVISLVLFPVRVLLVLMTLVVGVATVGGIVFGIKLWFDDGLMAAGVFGGASILPLALPIVIYVLYLVVVFMLDFYRAIVSIPRKIEELKK